MGGVSLLFQVCTEEERSGREDGASSAAWECCFRRRSGAFLSLYGIFVLFLSSFSSYYHVLAEVVVCAVGWVETLPAMEMTAQATALLVLVPPLQPKERGRGKKPSSQRC